MNQVARTENQSLFTQLDQIDQLLHARRHEQAMLAFLGVLNLLGTTRYLWSEERRSWRHGDIDVEVGEVCQRAAGQWQRLLTSNIDLTRIPFKLLIPRLDILHALLMGTWQGNLDGFIVALEKKTGGRFKVPDVLRLVLAWSPNSRLDWNPFGLHKMLPELVAAQAVAALCAMAPVSQFTDRSRNQAIDLLLSGVLPPQALSKFGYNPMALNAWMRCSYAEHQQKHAVKPWLAQSLAVMTRLPDTFELGQPRKVNGKPVLLIPLEGMVRDHAMFRCYASAIEACKERFHTVGLGMRTLVDESVPELFDDFEYITAPGADPVAFRHAFDAVQALIKRKPPTMVWYPGIGMHAFTVALCQRRLAPVQAMSFGHPASSMSEQMDYALIGAGHEGGSPIRETLKAFPVECAPMRAAHGWARPEPNMDMPADGVIRIAVPSIAPKLGAAFVDALRQVQEACGHKVKLVFFTGVRGVLYASAVNNLRKVVADAEYHPMLDYGDYLAELNRCHIHAGTYPFGGTNSLMDSLGQGLPVVAWRGEEAHGRIDAEFVSRAGLPDSFICDDQAGYVARLKQLVNDPDELWHWRRFLVENNVVDTVFNQAGRPGGFADVLADLLPEDVLVDD